MAFEYDIVVEAPDHTRVLVVECKRMKLTSDAEATQLRRSLMALGRDLAATYFMLAFPTSIFLAKSVETEADALDDAILRILECAEVIPLSEQILRDSFRAREQFSFQPQDSVVFASVDSFLNQRGKGDSIFANRNSKDFAVPEVKEHLAGLSCKLLSTFADAVGVIGHRARAD